MAFLTHEPFYPPTGGGSAEAIYIVEEFVRRGHELHLFCPRIENSDQIATRFGILIHPFNAFKMGRYAKFRNLKYLIYPFLLEKLVLQSDSRTSFDLLFSQHAIAAVTAGKLKRRLGSPVVMNFLDYLSGFMETWPAYVAPPPLLKLVKDFEVHLPARSGADAVLTVSDTLSDYFVNGGYPRERITPIYYGFDSELFPFRKPELRDPPVVVMHGSFDQHHLGKTAYDAMKQVLNVRPETCFRFVGHRTPTLLSFLRRLTDLFPNARLETTGFIPYFETAEQLKTATLGIVPYEESTGTHCAFVAKIVEYAGIGLPVVSTRLNSVSRYFQNEPTITFTDFNGADFGTGILNRLSDASENYSSAAEKLSQRVKRELDWRSLAARAVSIAERVKANARN
ncbi:MAG: glycosyltransferase family 4 protein [Verrucomicrobiota bacterium]|nr:glycosyltransferase family 4 protein [Verrucomicrobiota bacterium]